MSKGRIDSEKEQFWRMVVVGQPGSGLSIRGYCDREGLREASFYSWRREIQKRDVSRQAFGKQIADSGSEASPEFPPAARVRGASARVSGARTRCAPHDSTSFVPVDLIASKSCLPPSPFVPLIEIETSGGLRIRLAREIPQSTLDQVLNSLAAQQRSEAGRC